MAVIQRWPAYRGWWCTRIVLVDGFWDVSYWLVYRGDLLSQVAVSTGSTVYLGHFDRK